MIEIINTCMQLSIMKLIMYNKNGCGHGCGLSIGAWHVGVFICWSESIGSAMLWPRELACHPGTCDVTS